MITKEKLQSYINEFPDEISIDDLIDRLVFIEKLEKRIKISENGEDLIDHKDLKNEVEKWLE